MLNGRSTLCALQFIALGFLPHAAIAQQGTPSGVQPQNVPAATDPVLHDRPAPLAAGRGAITAEGSIHLDLTVKGADGKPVPGLEPADFKLLDNGQPRKILSFRSFDGIAVKPNPPVEVILLIDTVNLSFGQVAFVRGEIAKFLQQNGGHLAQPVSIMLLTDAGLRVQPRSSADGNALLSVLNQIKGGIHTINGATGAEGAVERFQISLKWMSTIAENEARKPGRKLLIWVGPGWPMLDARSSRYSERQQQRYFDEIVELSTRIREARLTLYSVSSLDSSLGEEGNDTFLYQDYLKPVTQVRKADSGNLGLKVLVLQSGGRILGPDNQLAAQIDQSIADADVFYTISFTPPVAEHANEYHDLKVEADKAGVTVRTTTGYYNQPPVSAIGPQ